MSSIRGTDLPQPQPPRKRFVKGQGWVTVEVWESPSRTAIEGKGAELEVAGYTNIELFSPDGIKWRVEGSIEGQGEGTPPELVNSWQLLSRNENADIITHPNVVSLDDDELRKVLDAIQSPVPGTAPGLVDSQAIELYTHMLRGVRQYVKPEYVLRHSLTVANDDAIAANASMTGTLKVWLGDDMPSMPPGLSAAVSVIENNMNLVNADPDMFKFGWLKQPTTITVNVFGTTLIEQEWWLANWPSPWVYQLYSP